MGDTEAERAAESFYVYVAQQMTDGVPRPQIEAALVENGLDEKTAAAVVADVARLRRKVARAAGLRSIAIGAFWLAVGFVLHWLLSSAGTESTFIAAAPAFVGVVLVVRGAARFLE